MNKFKLFSLVALSGSILFTGCGKDDEESAPEVSPQKLIGKTWKLTALNLNPAFTDPETGVSYSDLYSDMDECEKDNTILYHAADVSATSGHILGDEGAEKCDVDAPQTSEGAWAFANTEKTKLTQTQDGETVTVDLIEVTNTTMRQRYTDTFEGTTYTVIATFSAQ